MNNLSFINAVGCWLQLSIIALGISLTLSGWTYGQTFETDPVVRITKEMNSPNTEARRIAAGHARVQADPRLAKTLASLINEPDTDTRHAVANALAVTPGDDADRLVLEHLDHPDPLVRTILIKRFFETNDTKHFPHLKARTDDTDSTVRAYAAKAIRYSKDERASELCKDLLGHHDAQVQSEAALRFVEHPNDDVVPRLIKLVDSYHDETRRRATHTLRYQSNELVRSKMLEWLEHPDPEVRSHASLHLVSHPPVETDPLEPFIKGLEDYESLVRSRCETYLRRVNSPRAKAAVEEYRANLPERVDANKIVQEADTPMRLNALLMHSNASVRSHAARTLLTWPGKHATEVSLAAVKHLVPTVRHIIAARFRQPNPDPRAIDVLEGAISDISTNVRRVATAALSEIRGRRPSEICLQHVDDPVPGVRAYAIRRFANFPDNRATKHIIRLLNDPHTEVRASAAKAMAASRDPAIVPAAIEALAHTDPTIRRVIAERFTYAMDERAIPGLVQCLDDLHSEVRAYAASALSKTTGEAAIRATIDNLNHSDPVVRAALVYRFASRSDSRADSKLIRLLDDPSKPVRLNALRSLGRSDDVQHWSHLFSQVNHSDIDTRGVINGTVASLGSQLRSLLHSKPATTGALIKPEEWLRQTDLLPYEQNTEDPSAMVDLFNGDTLVGRIKGHVPATNKHGWVPTHLRILSTDLRNLATARNAPLGEIRVRDRWIKRIVWQRRPLDRYHPGTVFPKSGGRIQFRSIQWRPDGILILGDDQTHHFAFNDLAEVHMPVSDPWQPYLDQITIANLPPNERMLNVALNRGSVITIPSNAIRMFAEISYQSPGNGEHHFLPVWSLDTLVAGHQQMRLIDTRHRHAALLSLPPMHDPQSEGQWPWQINRNVLRGDLVTGKQRWAFGFGVHAPNTLEFPVPSMPFTFECRVGLDKMIGSGGCFRPVIRLADDTDTSDLHSGPIIIGSSEAYHTGKILVDHPGDNRTLALIADDAHANRPTGADPLNIRDLVNWLAPTITFDDAALSQLPAKTISRTVSTHTDWSLTDCPAGSFEIVAAMPARPTISAFSHDLMLTRTPSTLSRIINAGPHVNRIVIHAWRTEAHQGDGTVDVFVNDQRVSEIQLPKTQADVPAPIRIPCDLTSGSDIHLQLKFRDETANAGIQVRDVRFDFELPSPYAILDEEGDFRPLDPTKSPTALWVTDDKFTGERSLKIKSDHRSRLKFAHPIRIRKSPGPDAFRYIRIAFRKSGGGRLSFEFETTDKSRLPVRYDAGRGDLCYGTAEQVWQGGIPDAWVIATFDLYAAHGDVDLTSLVLGTPDGDFALFDYLYLVRKESDFRSLPKAVHVSNTNRIARRALVSTILEKGTPATVTVEIDGRRGSGSLVAGPDNQTAILSTGHLVVQAGLPARVFVPKVGWIPATSLGVDRTGDFALLKLDQTDRELPPPLKLGETPRDLTPYLLYVAFGRPINAPPAEDVNAYITIIDPKDDFIAASLQGYKRLLGGSMLNADGDLIGVHVRDAPHQFTRVNSLITNWPRLWNQEVFGRWRIGSAPMIGIVTVGSANGARVERIAPDSPAMKAGIQVKDLIIQVDDVQVHSYDEIAEALSTKDPGDSARFKIRRNDRMINLTITLLPRFRMN